MIDIGGVLAHVPGVFEHWSQRLRISDVALLRAIYSGNDDTVLIGRASEDDWWEIVRKRLDLGIDDVESLRSEMGAGQVWEPSLIDVIRDAKRTARTAILSNAWPSQRARMVALGLDDLVHELVLSCEIGTSKPNPKAFRLALDRLGTSAEKTLFIDDTAANVEAANALGFEGYLHVSNEEIITVIRRFLNSA